MEEWIDRIRRAEPRTVARVLRQVDDRTGDFEAKLAALFPLTGRAFVVGITGNPGAGKSTLTDRLIDGYRKRGLRVGVLCVDPSSPYSGGAILGDRIRMQRHGEDEGVFIRSVATRGHLGGLSRSARDMVRVLDAAGFDIILVETVGVGQDELEITRTAHTTLVVAAPGLGDEVQAIKAGILECADVFAVNKADRDGADGAVRDLELMIALGNDSMLALSKVRGHITHSSQDGHVRPAADTGSAASGAGPLTRWTPPIVKCVATRNEGTAALLDAIDRHRAWVEGTDEGRARRHSRLAEELRETLREALIEEAMGALRGDLDRALEAVESRRLDPYAAARGLVDAFRSRNVRPS
jgi:LAO/AO transport system kinase